MPTRNVVADAMSRQNRRFDTALFARPTTAGREMTLHQFISYGWNDTRDCIEARGSLACLRREAPHRCQ